MIKNCETRAAEAAAAATFNYTNHILLFVYGEPPQTDQYIYIYIYHWSVNTYSYEAFVSLPLNVQKTCHCLHSNTKCKMNNYSVQIYIN